MTFSHFSPRVSRIYRIAGPHLTAYIGHSSWFALDVDGATVVERRQTFP
jgi:hypothetical protein